MNTVHAGCDSCVEGLGFQPGDFGVERCDICQQFGDDNAARRSVMRILRTLALNHPENLKEAQAWAKRKKEAL